MKKTKFLLKAIAFSLAFIAVFQILPLSTIATELNNSDIEEIATAQAAEKYLPEIIGEEKTLRDEYTKHFRREDGSFVAAVYSEPVHYIRNGEWRDVDNTPVISRNNAGTAVMSANANVNAYASNSKYSISKTPTPVTFPDDIGEGRITITKGDNVISFGAKDTGRSVMSSAAIAQPSELVSSQMASAIEANANDNMADEDYEAKLKTNVKHGAISYTGAFENASLEYEVSSSMVKESIVVQKKADDYKYQFSINFGTYIPVKNENGGIDIYESLESTDPVMSILPPYMFDADNETSDAVTMDISGETGQDYTLTIDADAGWINSFGRKFPVVIDPTFVLDLGRNAVHDVHVNQNHPKRNYDTDYQIEIGKDGKNIYRTYIKYDLPTLPDLSVITYANIKLIQNWSRRFGDDAPFMNVYECKLPWDIKTINWENQPYSELSGKTVVDYTGFVSGMSAEYNLDITKIAKKWYEDGENNGLVLTSSDESVDEKTSFYASRNIVSNYPVVTINYVNNSGVESYWDYETVSLGDSGTAYINTYNGSLTYIHEDMSTNGLVAPVGISHVYSTDSKNASGTFLDMKVGSGFSLNVFERIEAVTSEQLAAYPYKYIDADGTVRFFQKTATANRFTCEFNSSVVLNYDANSSNARFIMSFEDGSKKYFNSNGYLVKTQDQNGNTITVNYTGKQITSVTDGAGKSLRFVYNTNKTLREIVDPNGRSILFNYGNGKLGAITYPEGNQTFFDYNEAGLLTKITKLDLSVVQFEYKAIAASGGTFYRVSKVSSHTSDLAHDLIDYLTFEYRTGDTLIKNKSGDELTIAFDNSGRAVNKTVNGEDVSTTGYNQTGDLNNTRSFASNMFSSVDNYYSVKRPTIYDGWRTNYDKPNNIVVSTYCNERTLSGWYSEKRGMEWKQGTIYDQARCFPTPGKTYTASAYVSILDELASGTVVLKLIAVDEEENELAQVQSVPLTTTDNQWRILNATMLIPENAAKMYMQIGLFEGEGIYYLDAVWVSEGAAPTKFNYIQNPSFYWYDKIDPPRDWIYPQRSSVSSEKDGTDCVLRFKGDPDIAVTAYQEYAVNGKAGDVLVFGANSKADCSASGNDGHRFYGIRMHLKDKNQNIIQTKAVQFNKEVSGTWQSLLGSIKAEQDYMWLELELCYEYEVNYAYFDDAFLYREAFGTYYSYNSNGTAQKVEDDNGNSVEYSYNQRNDLTQVISKSNDQVKSQTQLAYNNNHNLTQLSQNGKTTTTYNYPETGNKGLPISVTVTDSDNRSATTSYTYYDNYNYLKSVTDPTGATTEYEYDYGGTIKNGLLTKVTDPNGNVTEYEYNRRSEFLTAVSNPDETLGNPRTELSYIAGRKLSKISNADVSYSFTYNSYETTESVELGGTLFLATNQYDESGKLDTVTYANGDTHKVIYDDKNRVSEDVYNGTTSFKYHYNEDGNLGKLIDNDNDIEWFYQYDLAGRLTSAASDDNRMILYGYNDKNETESIQVVDNNTTVMDTRYSYDEYGTPSQISVPSMTGNPSQKYSVDDFGRVTRTTNVYNGSEEQNNVQTAYVYATKNGNQTGIVDSILFLKQKDEKYFVLMSPLKYNYDANGNITHVFEFDNQVIRYYYDGLNRLVREDNNYIDKTITYCYDKCGDILSKSEYTLTSAETLGEPVNTVTYSYTDANFKNAVTQYGDDAIVYDASGNPTSYRGYTMTWAKGRQLASLSGNGKSMSFKYDNAGIRTSKTVSGVETKYTYLGGTLVSQKTGDEVINFAYSAGGAPYGFSYNGQSYFYLLNLQGDVIGIYDGSGNIVVRYTYDSWGKVISVTGSLADTVGVKNPLRYRGYYYDVETKLYYLQSRYYDPETCRFINADSLLVAGDDYIQGVNMFAYCQNNPVVYSDPSGRNQEDGVRLFKSILFPLVSTAILLIVNMPYSEITALLTEIGDPDDMLYISMVILNGSTNGTVSLHPGIKGKQNFDVCKAFLNKNVCLKVAEYYTWAYERDGAAVIGIAQEIYAHALIFYESEQLLGFLSGMKKADPSRYNELLEYVAAESLCKFLIQHANPIDLGGNGTFDKIGTVIFSRLWDYF